MAGLTGDLAREIRRVVARLEDLLGVLERVEFALTAADKANRLNRSTPGRVGPSNAELKRLHRARSESRIAAEKGIRSVDIKRRENGSAFVRIDQKEPFTVAKKLADLLTILVSQPTLSDGFPAWLSRDVLVSMIEKKTGEPSTREALNELVYRLREAFRDAKLSHDLIESSRTEGLRIRLRRAPTLPTNPTS
jgi:hypothetical protein